MDDSKFEQRIKKLKWLAIIVGLLTFSVYIFRFYNHDFSSNPSDWGVFGDYISGVINPFISFINVLITYYIAEMVNRFSQRENEKQVLIQKKIIKSQLSYDSLKDFRQEIGNQFDKISDTTINIDQLKFNIRQALSSVDGFHQNYNHLFTDNPMFHSRLLTDLRSAIGTIDEYQHLGKQIDRGQLLQNLHGSKNAMLSNLNKEIIRKLEDN